MYFYVVGFSLYYQSILLPSGEKKRKMLGSFEEKTYLCTLFQKYEKV